MSAAAGDGWAPPAETAESSDDDSVHDVVLPPETAEAPAVQPKEPQDGLTPAVRAVFSASTFYADLLLDAPGTGERGEGPFAHLAHVVHTCPLNADRVHQDRRRAPAADSVGVADRARAAARRRRRHRRRNSKVRRLPRRTPPTLAPVQTYSLEGALRPAPAPAPAAAPAPAPAPALTETNLSGGVRSKLSSMLRVARRKLPMPATTELQDLGEVDLGVLVRGGPVEQLLRAPNEALPWLSVSADKLRAREAARAREETLERAREAAEAARRARALPVRVPGTQSTLALVEAVAEAEELRRPRPDQPPPLTTRLPRARLAPRVHSPLRSDVPQEAVNDDVLHGLVRPLTAEGRMGTGGAYEQRPGARDACPPAAFEPVGVPMRVNEPAAEATAQLNPFDVHRVLPERASGIRGSFVPGGRRGGGGGDGSGSDEEAEEDETPDVDPAISIPVAGESPLPRFSDDPGEVEEMEKDLAEELELLDTQLGLRRSKMTRTRTWSSQALRSRLDSEGSGGGSTSPAGFSAAEARLESDTYAEVVSLDASLQAIKQRIDRGGSGSGAVDRLFARPATASALHDVDRSVFTGEASSWSDDEGEEEEVGPYVG